MTPYDRLRSVRWDESRHVASPLLERSAIVAEATGCSYEDADERVWSETRPAQRALFGGDE